MSKGSWKRVVHGRGKKKERERDSTVSDYYWHCEVQAWGRKRENSNRGEGVYKNSGTRVKTADKVEKR